MAQATHTRKARPISPHLQIWRWGPGMAVSILHRATGSALSFGGLGLLLCWLGCLASGPETYALFLQQAGSWYGRIVLIGISWTYFNHLVSGLRHFLLDIGAGFEVSSNNRWSAISPVIGIVLTAAFWACLLSH
ncbi:succinate dehydrogenase, cytochrome b556 subunit [Novosphingobium umbonatum]|uniref:Succinate dehydrogenase cytochrome b556 subunit n=1 Tax=Novosphingobium umbonatum TaxID=1908524 RepID=A0A3S2Y2W3_9SPHN|nr:succinate dehydrogenase, cytochrome b556 subunit [Novosphingobium umbonatum]RVU02226.1 succinate dehydrogenase, cytochrome b556 subunit [Novosphingobium umbonatum]